MDDILKHTETQSSRIQYQISTYEQKYREAQEMLETLNENVTHTMTDKVYVLICIHIFYPFIL
jgi:hypothetical protein